MKGNQTLLEKQKQGIHCQQPYLTINVKENSLGRESMEANGYLDLH